MKKIIVITFFILCVAASAWGEASFEKTQESAKQGNADAQCYLALIYYRGKTPQDYKKALYWYTKSAEQGCVWAQYNLALKYYSGNGTPHDYKKAYAWSNLAFANGYEDARKLRDRVSKKLVSEWMLKPMTFNRNSK